MLLIPAEEADYPAIVELANLAYRGSAGWNSESWFIEGERLTEELLRQDLARSPDVHLLVFRETHSGEPLGTVWLEPKEAGIWYLGLLTVRPERQSQQLGRMLLAASEDFACARGARRIRMTVVNVRETLIAWYLRRGYALTGETQPFPYGDNRFGKPLRGDLYFVVLEKDL